ncbi:MAG TPA: ATP-binding protein [Candidatus Tumulicola sp.]
MLAQSTHANGRAHAERLRTTNPIAASYYIDHAGVVTDQLLEDVRETVAMLHGDAKVESIPVFSPLLERLRFDFESAHTARLSWNVVLDREPFGRSAITAYRIVQEAFTNVIKHARASSVSVDIRYEHEHLSITIEDDGCGFDEKTTEGHGLFSMRSRVESVTGSISITSTSGTGTRIEARIPFECEP